MKKISEPISDEAMERLAQLMTDSPSIVKLEGTEWEITGLKPGAQWMIAEEACRIVKQEKASMGDVIKEFAANAPSVCRVITIALINDKRALDRENADYKRVYDTLMWSEHSIGGWAVLLFEILKLIDVDFFFASTDVIATIREMTLKRKMSRKEQESSTAAPNGGR